MKKIVLSATLFMFTLAGYSQTLETNSISDWNKIQRAGFYFSLGTTATNTPKTDNQYWWGLSSPSAGNIKNGEFYNAQIAIANSKFPLEMYARSTSNIGVGQWSKILTDQGNQTIFGDLVLRRSETPSPFGEYGKILYFGLHVDNSDPLWMARYNESANASTLRVNIGDDAGGEDKFSVGNIRWNTNGAWQNHLVVTNKGFVGINGIDNPVCALDVSGTIRGLSLEVKHKITTEEVKIQAMTVWPDYVFNKEYALPTLSEVEAHISEHKHLPNIPSEVEVKKNGIDLGEMQAKLLQKIEELTLYAIEQNKKIEQMAIEIQELKSK